MHFYIYTLTGYYRQDSTTEMVTKQECVKQSLAIEGHKRNLKSDIVYTAKKY